MRKNAPFLFPKVIFVLILLFYAFICSAATPPNNECSGAINIIPVDSTKFNNWVTQSIFGATASEDSIICNVSHFSEYDVWYSFKVNSPRLLLQFWDDGGLYEIDRRELYAKSDCGDKVFESCISRNVDLQNLNLGDEYFVRIIGYSPDFNVNYRISMPLDPPKNDECDQAIFMLDDVDVEGQIAGATSEQILNSCHNDAQGDVWYSFISNSVFYNIIGEYVDNFPVDVNIELFKNDCSALESLECHESIATNTFETHVPLAVGALYKIRISGGISDFGKFKFKIIPVSGAINDKCEDAFLLDIENRICSGHRHRISPTLNLDFPPCWSLSTPNDSWFKFVASDSVYFIEVNGSGDGLAIYKDGCEEPELISCEIENELRGLSIGETYLIRSNRTWPDEICISESVKNDRCTDAIELIINGTYTLASFVNASATNTSCESNGLKDIWYRFKATSKASNLLLIGDKSSEIILSIFQNSCGDNDLLVCFDEYVFANTRHKYQMTDLIVGTDYFIKLSAENLINSSIAIEKVPINNEFAGAFEIRPFEQNCISANFNAATPSPNIADYTSARDLWYFFVADSTAYECSYDAPQFDDDLRYNIYSESQVDSLNLLYSSNEMSRKLSGFTVGKKYFLRLIALTNSDYHETFCFQEYRFTASNDQWFTADTLYTNDSFNCQKQGDNSFTQSSANIWENGTGRCTQYMEYPDLWYVFTAESELHILSPQNLSWTGVGHQLFESMSDTFACPIQEGTLSLDYLTLRNLKIGHVYYLRIFISTWESGFSRIPTICLLTAPPYNVNDDLDRVEEIPVVKPNNCFDQLNEFWSGFNEPTDTSLFQIRCDDYHINKGDLWYSFIASDSSLGISITNYTDLELYRRNIQKRMECLGEVEDGMLSGLVKGDRYYLRFIDLYNTSLLKVQFCLFEYPDFAVNDELDDAIELIPSGSLVDCYSDSVRFNRTEDFSVWFYFTATAENHQLQVDPVTTSDIAYFSSLFLKDEEEVGTKIYEFDWSSGGLVSPSGAVLNLGSTLHNYTDLTIGQEYFIELFVPGGLNQNQYFIDIDYSICLKTLPEFPVNDEINFAIELTPQTDEQLNFTYGYATRANFNRFAPFEECGEPDVGPFQNINPEVWYKFTAVDQQHGVHFRNLTTLPLPFINKVENLAGLVYYLSLYEKQGSQIRPIDCYNLADSVVNFDGLIAGNVYFIKVQISYVNYLTDLEFEIAVGETYVGLKYKNPQIDILVYPNPSNDYVNIEADSDISLVRIFDLQGRILKQLNKATTSNLSVDLNGFSEGIYLLEIHTSKGTTMKRMLKTE